MSGFRSDIGPNITRLRNRVRKPTSSNSLESRDLGVLQGGCESNHARHVFAVIGEVVLGQAASTSEREFARQQVSEA